MTRKVFDNDRVKAKNDKINAETYRLSKYVMHIDMAICKMTQSYHLFPTKFYSKLTNFFVFALKLNWLQEKE